jgi:hypothetical protein
MRLPLDEARDAVERLGAIAVDDRRVRRSAEQGERYVSGPGWPARGKNPFSFGSDFFLL